MTAPQTLRMPVASTLLAEIAYSSDQTADIQLRDGTTYRYFAVPPLVFAGLILAPSKGTYFNRFLKDRFRHQRLA